MKNDPFWKFKITDYCQAYAFFHKTFVRESGIDDPDCIMGHWLNLIESVCDCEGCREEEDCTVHIACDDEDESPADWEGS